jgi:hypothetical protein
MATDRKSQAPDAISDFIGRWSNASASERANSQLFLSELCRALEVAPPDPRPNSGYAFEYSVTEHHTDGNTTRGLIDLYKRGCFVLESKQFQEAKAEPTQLELAAEAAGVLTRKKSSQPIRGTDAWDDAMIKARGQAERYIRALPVEEGNPPFLIVLDVGHTFDRISSSIESSSSTMVLEPGLRFMGRKVIIAQNAMFSGHAQACLTSSGRVVRMKCKVQTLKYF